MARVLVLHTPKGGSGKSTLARELAVGIAGAALVDLDPQKTTTGWYARRKAEAPPLFDPGALARGLPDDIRVVVVDTPPGALSGRAATALRSADLVLVPVRPSPDDLLAAAPIARSLEGREWAFVVAQAQRTRFAAQVREKLTELGPVLRSQVSLLTDFLSAAVTGQAAVEFPTKAGGEIRALAAEVATLLGRGR